MPQQVKKYVEDANKKSQGKFNAKNQEYQNEVENLKPTKLGKCDYCSKTCDVVCSRCSTYFCGLECQQLAWPEHRHYCGKPK